MAVVINAVTPLIGNALLDAGGAFTVVVSVPGAAVIGMSVDVSPETFPGEGVVWGGFVSGAGQVTVKVWRFTTGYVLGSVYNINVLTGSDAPAALELETNGTPNSSQTLLNLVAGTNVTLTDEGGGSIQIAASGGGGGGFAASQGLPAPSPWMERIFCSRPSQMFRRLRLVPLIISKQRSTVARVSR